MPSTETPDVTAARIAAQLAQERALRFVRAQGTPTLVASLQEVASSIDRGDQRAAAAEAAGRRLPESDLDDQRARRRMHAWLVLVLEERYPAASQLVEQVFDAAAAEEEWTGEYVDVRYADVLVGALVEVGAITGR